MGKTRRGCSVQVLAASPRPNFHQRPAQRQQLQSLACAIVTAAMPVYQRIFRGRRLVATYPDTGHEFPSDCVALMNSGPLAQNDVHR
jgi:hypothetical protein